jgi:hypothetical protein
MRFLKNHSGNLAGYVVTYTECISLLLGSSVNAKEIEEEKTLLVLGLSQIHFKTILLNAEGFSIGGK